MSETVEEDTRPNSLFEELLKLDLSDLPISVCLASSEKDKFLPDFTRLQLSNEVIESFRSVAAYTLKHYQRNQKRHNLVIHDYTVESKLDTHEIEALHLPDYEHVDQQLEALGHLIDIEPYEDDEHFIANLRFYAIVVQTEEGQPLYFLRSYTQKRMLTQPSRFAVWQNHGEFNRVTQPVFVFDHEIDCIASGQTLFILKKENFHTMFRFFEIVRKVARETLEIIRKHVPVQNFDEFAQDCEANLVKLVKLRNISSKPYIHQITMTNIKRVIRRNNLAIKIIIEDGREKLVYDPKDTWTILRLLDDDYLWSPMTEQNYEVTGKRELQQHSEN